MAEEKYTWDDIIIDPTSDRAKEAVGNECYFSLNPAQVLERANRDCCETGFLAEIQHEEDNPFLIQNKNGCDSLWCCIIVKKEEPYSERAKKWIEENNLKVGDYVKVLRKAKSLEDGWNASWNAYMDHYIGKTVCVDTIEKEDGNIYLSFGDSFYNFPYFVLEKAKAPKLKYVPFESKEEFVEAYNNHGPSAYNLVDSTLFYSGMWLKQKEPKAYVMITELWDVGVVIGDNKFTIEDDKYVCNDTTSWVKLFSEYRFLDGSSCGKESKDE